MRESGFEDKRGADPRRSVSTCRPMRASMKALVTVPGLLVGLASARAAAGEPSAPPDVPVALRVPAGAHLLTKFHATGAQVYTCAPNAGAFGWTLKQPDATLFDAAGAKAGTHGAGPSWTATDGSGVKGQKVAQADAPSPTAVPWLLLRATSTTGHGQLAAVTYVQRLNTQGGKAPAAGCDAGKAGSETRASYSADYYFFTGGVAPPGSDKPKP
jgi:hypothetical protein